jgi:hypothetical protein
LQTQTSNINGTLSTQAGQITALQSSQATQDNQIFGNSTAISNLTTTTSNLSGQISTNSNAITSLQSTVTAQAGTITGQATAISNLSTYAGNIDSSLKATASFTQVLSTTVDGQKATITFQGNSINGIQLNYGVVFSIDGQTGGYIFEGVRRIDGAVQYQMKLRGDLVVDGSIFSRALGAYQITADKLTTGQLIVNGQLFDAAATQLVVTSTSGNQVEGRLYVRGTGGLLITAFFNGNSAFLSTNQPGNFIIRRDNGQDILTVPAAFGIYRDGAGNNLFNVLAMAIGKYDAPGAGVHSYTAIHSNASNIGGVTLVIQELSK